MKLIFLLAGGAIGTLGRYLISGWVHQIYLGLFPLGTLIVNGTGSFVIGLIWGMTELTSVPSTMRTFIFIGILGGFTTFSSFALESMNLFRDGEIKLGIVNILANNFLALFLVFGGYFLGRGLINLIK
ncbi:fluoride efflux transporter FluC [Bacteroidota bacterium]